MKMNLFPDCDNIHIIIQCLEPLNGLAGTYVCVQVELLPQLQVKGPETLANRGHQGTL